mgnify:CR=1 FL=1
MDFFMGLLLGAAAGFLMEDLLRNGCPFKSDADKHVDNLNAQAQKNLHKLQQSRNQIAQVSQKAGDAHRDLQSKIHELASQE